MRGAARLSLLLAAGAFALAGSCSAKVTALLEAGGGAKIEARVLVPPALAARLRALEGRPAAAPLLGAATARRTLEARPGLVVVSASNPDPDSLLLSVSAPDLATVLAAPDLAADGLLRLGSSGSERELTLRLERGRTGSLASLVPGLDRDLLEALSPPLLDRGAAAGSDTALSKAEYRQALGALLGSRVLPELDAAALDFAITLPGQAVSSSGGRLEGRVFTFSLPLLDLLALEKPLEYRVRWIQ